MGHLIPAGTGFQSHRSVDIELTVEEPEPIRQEGEGEGAEGEAGETPEGEAAAPEAEGSEPTEGAESIGGIDLDSLDGGVDGDVKESA